MQFKSTPVQSLYTQVRDLVKAQMPSEKQPQLVELVLNISEGCNLTCPYCFAGQGQYNRPGMQWMSRNTVRSSIISFLSIHPTIETIKLFGGEPFMNINAMEEAFDTLDSLATEKVHPIRVGCVTNMTIFSPRIVDLYRRGLRFNISLDGPPQIHDANRRFRNGKGSFKRIEQTVAKYRNSGVEPSGIDSVFTPLHLEAGWTIQSTMDYLQSTFDIEQVLLTPFYTPNETFSEDEFAKTVREQTRYATLGASLSGKQKSTLVKNARKMLTSPSRITGWCGLGRTTVTVMSDGSILPCYTVAASREAWRHEDDLAAGSVYTSKRMLPILLDANPRTNLECANCAIRDCCVGCPGGTFASTGKFHDVVAAGCSYRLGMIEGYLESKIK